MSVIILLTTDKEIGEIVDLSCFGEDVDGMISLNGDGFSLWYYSIS
jgi:hypothetical protein